VTCRITPTVSKLLPSMTATACVSVLCFCIPPLGPDTHSAKSMFYYLSWILDK
jgi:hypothetical protein